MKKLIAIVLTIILLLSLTACSSGNLARSGGGDGGYGYAPAAAPAPEMPLSEADYYRDDGGYVEAENISADLAGGNSVRDGRKITFSASVSLNTKQFDADYAALNALINKSGGFIANESMVDNSASYGRPTGRSANISARVPAGDYDTFVDAVTQIGEITQKNKWSDDLTAQYFDTEARIELLELRKERLMNYLLEADNAEAIVAFERELSDVLYELDNFQGNKRRLDRLVDYASVDIYLTELITPETIGKDGEPLGDRARDAFSLSLTNLVRGLQDFVVGFAGAVPVIVLLLIIGAIIWAIVRATRPLREKMRDRREAREAKRLERRQQRQKNQPYPPPPPQYWQQPVPPPPPQAPPPQATQPQAPQAPPPEPPEEK